VKILVSGAPYRPPKDRRLITYLGPRSDGPEETLLKQIAETEERLFLLRMRLDQFHRRQRRMITIVSPPHSAPLTPISPPVGPIRTLEASKAAVSLPEGASRRGRPASAHGGAA
jgi:hypothetical protein